MSVSARIGLGIDTGGTYTKIIAVSEQGRVLRRTQVATYEQNGPMRFVKRVAASVRKIEKSLGRQAHCVCLAIAGDVDAAQGRLRRSPNLPAFENFLMKKHLSKVLLRDVQVHNDANMAAWGCYALELRRRFQNVVALTLGTGIGGGMILNGALYTGATGSAGEWGHVRIDDEGALCRCGARGCLEAYAGKYGIVRTARDVLKGRPQSARLMALKNLEPHHLSRAAWKGDAGARDVWRRMGSALGAGIVNIVYAFNPDAIVFSGAVAQSAPLFMGALRRRLRKESFRAPFGHVRISAARTSDLGAVGAALYSLEKNN